MRTIRVGVSNKIAKNIDHSVIICGNSDYQVSFILDEEWQALFGVSSGTSAEDTSNDTSSSSEGLGEPVQPLAVVARFIINNQVIDKPIITQGDQYLAQVPVLSNGNNCEISIYAETGGQVITTTSAFFLGVNTNQEGMEPPDTFVTSVGISNGMLWANYGGGQITLGRVFSEITGGYIDDNGYLILEINEDPQDGEG